MFIKIHGKGKILLAEFFISQEANGPGAYLRFQYCVKLKRAFVSPSVGH